MKNTFLAILSLIFLNCSTEPETEQNKLESAVYSIPEPVNNLNGVYYGRRNNKRVNIDWYSNYPDATFTLKRNGVIMTSNSPISFYTEVAENGFHSAEYSVTQTVNGITSEEVSVIVSRFPL